MNDNYQSTIYTTAESRFGLEAQITVWRDRATGAALHLTGILLRDSAPIYAKTFELDERAAARCTPAEFRPDDFTRRLVKDFAALPATVKMLEASAQTPDAETLKAAYDEKFSPLFELGEIEFSAEDPSPAHLEAYNSLNLSDADGARLVKIALDQRFSRMPSPSVWTPVHVWRIIGVRGWAQFAAELGELLLLSEEDDWIEFDFPYYFAKLGAAAVLPVLGALLDNPAAEEFHLLVACDLWAGVAKKEEPRTLDFLIGKLENYRVNSSFVNSLLISGLLSLKSTRGLSLIEKVIKKDPDCLNDMIGTKAEVMRDIRAIRQAEKATEMALAG